nr:MAG TPA: hypothetical protein [Caudoviricetes sp.]
MPGLFLASCGAAVGACGASCGASCILVFLWAVGLPVGRCGPLWACFWVYANDSGAGCDQWGRGPLFGSAITGPGAFMIAGPGAICAGEAVRGAIPPEGEAQPPKRTEGVR